MNEVGCETKNRPAILALNTEKKLVIFFRPRCKLWSCPYCADINRRLWTARAYHAAEVWHDQGKELDFVTLTSHEKLTAKQSWYVWPKAWKKLLARAKYYSKQAEFALVPEQHQDGRIHVHMVATFGLTQAWWKTNGRECGLGYMAEEELVKSPAAAASYVHKYINKQLGAVVWPKGFRRVRTSHQFPKLPPPAPLADWSFKLLPTGETNEQTVYKNAIDQGYYPTVQNCFTAWEFIRMVEENTTDD